MNVKMKNKTFYTLAAVLVVASVVFWIFMFQNRTEVLYGDYQSAEISLTMYHSPTCGCCVKWAAYLENNGVNVTTKESMNLEAVKKEHGVPNQLSSCHTAIVDGYVVEGHVPVEDIRKMLAERPNVVGISVPGMPPNSPGMDMPSDETYQSVLFDEENMTVFNTHK